MPKSDICWLCYIVAFLGASFCASLGTVEKWHQRGPVAQWPCPRMRLAFLWRWVCHCYCHSHACLGAMFDECWFFHLLCKPAALQPRLHCLDYCAQAHQSPSRVGSSTRVKGAVIIAYQKKQIWIQVEKTINRSKFLTATEELMMVDFFSGQGHLHQTFRLKPQTSQEPSEKSKNCYLE